MSAEARRVGGGEHNMSGLMGRGVCCTSLCVLGTGMRSWQLHPLPVHPSPWVAQIHSSPLPSCPLSSPVCVLCVLCVCCVVVLETA
jgi:hypothetical protein